MKPLNLLASCIAALSLAACSSSGSSSPGVAGNANPGTGGGNIGTSPSGGGNGSTNPTNPGNGSGNDTPTGPGAGNANPTPTDPTPAPDPDLSDVQGNLLRTLVDKEWESYVESRDVKYEQLHKPLQSDNINTVLLDGEKITLIPACYFSGQGCVAGMAGPDYRRVDPKDDENRAVTDHSKMYYNWRRNRDGEPIQKTVASKHLNYARYGWVYFYPPAGEPLYFGKEAFFAHGQPTALEGKEGMPLEGKADYRGYALVSFGHHPTSEAPARYDTHFHVDFGSKSLTGKLNTNKKDYASLATSSVELKATISGNTFRGDSSHFDGIGSEKIGVYTEGGFYGPGAQELAGVFVGRVGGEWDYPVLSGSFGASKQTTAAPKPNPVAIHTDIIGTK